MNDMTNTQPTIDREISSLLEEVGTTERLQREAQELLERAAAMQQGNRSRALELIVRLANRVDLSGDEVARTIEADAKQRARQTGARKPKAAVGSADAEAVAAGSSSGGTAANQDVKPKSGVVIANPADPSLTWSGRGRRPPWVTTEMVIRANEQQQGAQA